MAETLGKILRPFLPHTTPELPDAVTSESKRDPELKMQVLAWQKNNQVAMDEMARPLITDDNDAIVRITSTTICGSDLHLFHGDFQGMHNGDVMGHEFMGVVEEVGSNVKSVKKGDRVVVSSVICCGECEFCKKEQFSACDRTNPSKEVEALAGHRCAGFFGYSHLTGKLADNLFNIPRCMARRTIRVQ
jgi:threonine dehydrogenase-like Zn-dependent dehydrogenase